MRSRKDEPEDVVESLLRLVVEPESERASYDGLALWRERDEGIGGGA
jgi:hypothetical protein